MISQLEPGLERVMKAGFSMLSCAMSVDWGGRSFHSSALGDVVVRGGGGPLTIDPLVVPVSRIVFELSCQSLMMVLRRSGTRGNRYRKMSDQVAMNASPRDPGPIPVLEKYFVLSVVAKTYITGKLQ